MVAKKIEGLVSVLNEPVIDIDKLKLHLSEGIPDEAKILREYSWKVVLGYLPSDKSQW
jgi:hypothetical protein